MHTRLFVVTKKVSTITKTMLEKEMIPDLLFKALLVFTTAATKISQTKSSWQIHGLLQ